MIAWIWHCLTCWSDDCLRAMGYDGMMVQALTLAVIASIFVIGIPATFFWLEDRKWKRKYRGEQP